MNRSLIAMVGVAMMVWLTATAGIAALWLSDNQQLVAGSLVVALLALLLVLFFDWRRTLRVRDPETRSGWFECGRCAPPPTDLE